MTNPFTSFQFSCPEDVFNETIGGAWLPVGKHSVTISSAEVINGDYGLQLKLGFADSAGKTANKMFNLIAKPNAEKPGVFPHFVYVMFGQAAFLDPVVRTKIMMSVLPSNTALASELKGIKLGIEIVPPSKGFTIQDQGDKKIIVDVADNSTMTDQSFDSFEEAKTFAKASGFKQAYTNVERMFALEDSIRTENDKIGRALIESSTSAPSTPRPRTVSV
jgi:hypothetical protein